MDTPINPAAIETIRRLDPDNGAAVLAEILGLYLRDTPTDLSAMRRAWAAGDSATLTRSAHNIKSSSCIAGADAVRAVAARIEEHGHAGNLAAAAALMDECDAAFVAAAEALCNILHGTPDA